MEKRGEGGEKKGLGGGVRESWGGKRGEWGEKARNREMGKRRVNLLCWGVEREGRGEA